MHELRHMAECVAYDLGIYDMVQAADKAAVDMATERGSWSQLLRTAQKFAGTNVRILRRRLPIFRIV